MTAMSTARGRIRPGQAGSQQAADVGEYVAAVRQDLLVAGDALEDHDQAGEPDEQERH
jgi:hypothetical protein